MEKNNEFIRRQVKTLKFNFDNGESATIFLYDDFSLTTALTNIKWLSDLKIVSLEEILESTITTPNAETFTSRTKLGTYYIGKKMSLEEAFQKFGNDPSYINVLAHMRSDHVTTVCLNDSNKLIAIQEDDRCLSLEDLTNVIKPEPVQVEKVASDDLKTVTRSTLAANYGLGEERYFDRNQVSMGELIENEDLNSVRTYDTDVITYNGEMYFGAPKNQEIIFIGQKLSLAEAFERFGNAPSYINVLAHLRTDGYTTVCLTPYNKLIGIKETDICMPTRAMVTDEEYHQSSK